jgi:hypothetical protein
VNWSDDLAALIEGPSLFENREDTRRGSLPCVCCFWWRRRWNRPFLMHGVLHCVVDDFRVTHARGGDHVGNAVANHFHPSSESYQVSILQMRTEVLQRRLPFECGSRASS